MASIWAPLACNCWRIAVTTPVRGDMAIKDRVGDNAKNGFPIEDLANGIACGVQER